MLCKVCRRCQNSRKDLIYFMYIIGHIMKLRRTSYKVVANYAARYVA